MDTLKTAIAATPVTPAHDHGEDPCGCGHDHHHHGHAHGHHHHAPQATIRRAAPKVGRNDPCPCGSGQKHKKCCLNG
jgi:preprotein translocase subunit SecA